MRTVIAVGLLLCFGSLLACKAVPVASDQADSVATLPMEVSDKHPVQTKDGSIITPSIAGAGWQWVEDSRKGDDFSLSEIKWRRASPEGEVYLYAKDYTGPNETVQSLCAGDWRAQYQPLFTELTSVKAEPSTQSGMTACRVVAEGRTSKGLLRLEERYIPVRGHTLILTVGGDPKLLSAFEKPIATWFSGVTFTTLRESSSTPSK